MTMNPIAPRTAFGVSLPAALTGLALFSACGDPEMQMRPPVDLSALLGGLTDAARTDYTADGDGGLAHVSYFTIKSMSPEWMALPKAEQVKLQKLQSSILHSAKLPPSDRIAGTEITGTLQVKDADGERTQEVVLKLPVRWNGKLAVAGTPGTRSEFASDAVLATWLLRRGFAYVAGNKGMTNGGADGNASLLKKAHATRHWGAMMLDMAEWAGARLEAATGTAPERTYAVGLSNGGYQVRRALEIDHVRVKAGKPRRFDGGLEWAGVYWPDARVLDKDKSGTVSADEFAGATHLVSSMDRAALAMGWPYDMGAKTTPKDYAEQPRFSMAQAGMTGAGFRAESAVLWGAYSLLFDALKAALPAWRGVGYYNVTGYYYRADLLGHDDKDSAPYSIWAPMGAGHPAYYDFVATAPSGGWTADSVTWALKNANTGEFSAPMISVHGDRDALIGLPGNGEAYDAAVRAFGQPALHRLYIVQNGNHVDAHADGALDYDCNGKPGDEGAADEMVPLQPYVERAFELLTDWVERGSAPPASRTVPTDPKNDVLDSQKVTF